MLTRTGRSTNTRTSTARNPPDFADPITDELDAIILKSEGIPTLETVNALAYTRRVEAERRVENRRREISPKALQSIAADDAMAALDDCLWQNVRDQAGVTEDGGWAHLDKTAAELVEGQKVVKGQREAAARERQATARRFNGFGYKTVTEKQFYRGKKG